MPFTGSHPAAVLPFLRTPLPASALVIGSMAPDLPYYLPVDLGLPTHTALAVVTTDLVLGALAWAVWHGVLAAPALAAAPAALRGRLTGEQTGLRHRLAPARLAWLLPALVMGATTHVLWDEFTHPRRWGTAHVAALHETWWLLPGYRWAQYLSGLVGGAILLMWLARWWQRSPVRPVTGRPGPSWAWGAVAAVGAVAGGIAAAGAPSIGAAGFVGATWGGGTALAVALVLAVVWHATRRHRSADPDAA